MGGRPDIIDSMVACGQSGWEPDGGPLATMRSPLRLAGVHRIVPDHAVVAIEGHVGDGALDAPVQGHALALGDGAGRFMVNMLTVVVPAAQMLEVSTDYLLLQSDERKGENREGGSRAEEPQEDASIHILRLAIQDMPDPDRPELLRFLIRQVAVYRDTFSKK